jgi:LPXTG-motif cell wall-anchored protein
LPNTGAGSVLGAFAGASSAGAAAHMAVRRFRRNK